jgi:hypothetical protein
MDGSYEYIEFAVMGSRQRVVLQLEGLGEGLTTHPCKKISLLQKVAKYLGKILKTYVHR